VHTATAAQNVPSPERLWCPWTAGHRQARTDSVTRAQESPDTADGEAHIYHYQITFRQKRNCYVSVMPKKWVSGSLIDMIVQCEEFRP
jgi:hypothetical protein